MQQNPQIQTKQEKPVKKKILRYVLIGIFSFFMLIVVSAILIPVLFEGQVKRIFLQEINKQLATAVVVDENDIDLTLLKNFPNGSVVFKNIGIRESIEGSEKYFLKSEEIRLLFNVRDILRGNYIIKTIIVNGADVTLLTDAKGNINYKFWKDTEDTSQENSDFSVLLEKVTCSNINFIYTDKKSLQNMHLFARNAVMSGNFTSDNYKLTAEGNILSHFIRVGTVEYFADKEADIAAELFVNAATNTYTFEKGNIIIDNSEFVIGGSIQDAEILHLDLLLKSDETDIETLLLLLPARYASAARSIASKGDLKFETTIKGNYTKKEFPAVELSFNMENGSIYNKNFGEKLSDVRCSGIFSNGEKKNAQTSSLIIKNLQARYAHEPLVFSLICKNFSDPYIDMRLDGNIPASILFASASDKMTDADGFVAFEGVAVKGQVKSLRNVNALQDVKGKFSCHDVSFVINQQHIKIQAGTAELANGEIVLQNLQAKIFDSDVSASLQVHNWAEAVFNASSKTRPPLYVSGSVTCSALDINTYIKTFSGNTLNTEKEQSITQGAKHTDWMQVSGNLTLQVGRLLYDNLLFEQVKSEVKLSPGFIGLKNFTGTAMQGNFNLQATFRRLADENYLLEMIGILNGINIRELFAQMDNFNQQTLTDKHINGKATAYIENLGIQWDKNYRFIEQSVYSLVNIKIENGELNNYKPLESLSKFIHLSDLQNISFSTMQNQVEIKNSTIHIPAMEIRSSALDIDLSGTHTFDNAIDYQLKLGLGELLAGKFFGKSKNKENYETGDKGGIYIYVSMTGTVDKPVIAYNKREAKQKMDEQGNDKPSFIDIFKPDAPAPQDRQNKLKNDDADRQEDDEPLEFIEWEDE